MMQIWANNKKLIIAIIIIIVIYFIYIQYNKNKAAKEEGDLSVKPNYTNTGGAASNSSTWKDDSYPLKLYSSGERVFKLQAKINTINTGKKLVEDGKMGPKTVLAVNATKKALGKPENGQVSKEEFEAFVEAPITASSWWTQGTPTIVLT